MDDVEKESRLARLRKIRELVKNGTEGEKEAARLLYDKLKSLYGVSDELDIALPELFDCEFRYRTNLEKRLLFNVIFMVVGNAEVCESGRRKVVMVHCTRSEEAEIELCYYVYKLALEKHMERSFEAFLIANRIFPDDTVRCPFDDSPLDIDEERKKELEQSFRLAKMVDETVLPRGMIPEKGVG